MRKELRYWMSFYNNSNNLILELSDTTLIGLNMDVDQLMNRLYAHMLNKQSAKYVKVTIKSHTTEIDLLIGYKNKDLTIIREGFKEKYTLEDLTLSLYTLQKQLSCFKI